MTTTTTRRRPADATGAAPAPGLSSVRVDPADAASVTGFADLPGLAARLARMAAELRLLTRNAPVWAMGAAGLGDAIEQAQMVREMAHSLTAVLTAEVDSRGLADDAGLSRNDWVAGHAPGLADGASAALTAVGAAMNEPRWQRLSALVRGGDVSVDKAAIIVRFRSGVEATADPEQLEAVVTSMVEAAPALSVKQLRRLASHARAVLRPPKDVEDEDARLRAGRSFTKIGRSAGLIRYLLQLDPEGAAILDAALDPLSRPRPDLDWAWWPSATASSAQATPGSPEDTADPSDGEPTHPPHLASGETSDGHATHSPDPASAMTPQDADRPDTTDEPGDPQPARPDEDGRNGSTGHRGRSEQGGADGCRCGREAMAGGHDGYGHSDQEEAGAHHGCRCGDQEEAAAHHGCRCGDQTGACERHGSDDRRPADPLTGGPCTGGSPGRAASAQRGDPRSAPNRRADALLELLGRAVSSPKGAPTTPRTKLVVTMTLDALLDALRGAGLADNDEVLSAGTVRRLACEAQIIPMVLGGRSHVLDLGQVTRFFSPAQRLALSRRDGGCSYPGCTVPPQWCEAHHVVHWSRGGATDLRNGALLCGRHHTIVHQLDLAATVDPDRITWHVPWDHRRP